MQFRKIPLQARIDMQNADCCAHQEYVASVIYRFANLPVTAYFHGLTKELSRLEFLLGVSHQHMQRMTFKQLAHKIDEDLYHTPSCGDAYLYDAIELLTRPLSNGHSGQVDHGETDRHKAGSMQPTSLDERLGKTAALGDCIMTSMEVGGLLPFFDEMVLPRSTHFEQIYHQYFSHYGSLTFAELLAKSAQMPTAERRDIQYYLLVHFFSQLDENPRS